MKILDEKSRLFGVINPVDLLLILGVIVVLFIVASVLFPNVSPTKSAPSEVVRATILVGGVRGFVPTSIKVGDPMNRKTGGKMGKVTDVKAQPAVFEEPTAAGHAQAVDVDPVHRRVHHGRGPRPDQRRRLGLHG